MKRILSSSLAAALILLSPSQPFDQALASSGEARPQFEPVSHDQFIQNLMGWQAVLTTSPNILQSFDISKPGDFIAVAARIPGFEPPSNLTTSYIENGMRTYVQHLAALVSQTADQAKPEDCVELDRLNAELKQARPLVALIVPDEMAILDRAAAQATESKGAVLNRLTEQANAWKPGYQAQWDDDASGPSPTRMKRQFERLLDHFKANHAPPETGDKTGIRRYWLALTRQSPNDWPKELRDDKSPEARELLGLLVAEHQRRAVRPPRPPRRKYDNSPFERLLEYVKAHHEIPRSKPGKYYRTAYFYWINNCVKKSPSEWPKELRYNDSPEAQELRELLLAESQRRAVEPPRKTYDKPSLGRLLAFVKVNHALPRTGMSTEESSINSYCRKNLIRKSSDDWPEELSDDDSPEAQELRKLVLAEQQSRRARLIE